MFHETLSTIKRLDLEDELKNVGFTNFKLRHAGRYDLQARERHSPGAGTGAADVSH